MGGFDPDELVRTGYTGSATAYAPRWIMHTLAAAQWLQAADAVDPLRKSPNQT
jgi:hypothetical protein